ncbi:10374_t:CDS:2 [Cetraspora pellucida]|uniref:10374_t:CDS:1 n=1 Tax=Cetraspora pellucida TaxID=1433469 RepID=A0ACA9K2N3_9GLOM|nr:10374_t:CDS:2 [Cetraspora pellucida]
MYNKYVTIATIAECCLLMIGRRRISENSHSLYTLFVATVTLRRLNITANHLSTPFLIGYAVIEIIVAPSGLFGICGAISNNVFLMNRYARDHWFSVFVLTIIDIIKIILSFTMKNNNINSCFYEIDEIACEGRVTFNIYAGLVVFGAQEIILDVKEIDMEVQESHVANDVASTLSIDVLEKRQYMDQESLIANPPSPFIRRPTQLQRQANQLPNEIKPEYSRMQENQGNSRVQENLGNSRVQENHGNSKMQENHGNSRTTQNTQGFDQIHTASTRNPVVPMPPKQGSQDLPLARSSTSYNNPLNSRPPIIQRRNTALTSQQLTNYQQMPQYVPDMRSVNGNGIIFPPILNQTESISGFQLPQQPQQLYRPHNKVLSHKRSDSFPQPRSIPLPPIPNNPGIYQVSQQSAYQRNKQYNIDQRSTIQSNSPYLSSNHSKSLPNLHNNIIDPSIPPIPPIPSNPVPNSKQPKNIITPISNNIITPLSNNIYSQPKTLNNSFQSLEESNIIPNSSNRTSYVTHSRLSNQVSPHPYGVQGSNSKSANKQTFNQKVNNGYTNNSYVAQSRLTNQIVPYDERRN